MTKEQKRQYIDLVERLHLEGLNENEIIIELVFRAPLIFTRDGALKFIKAYKEGKIK